MSQTGIEIDDRTLEAWADITLKVWQQRTQTLGFSNDDEHLRDSLPDKGFIAKHSGGQAAKISFDFNMYGTFVDMGVGRGVEEGNREPKEWFQRNWYREIQRLKEIMAKKYSFIATRTVNSAIDDFFGGSVCQTGKGARYTAQQSARNARNYNKRRAKAGRWTNNHKTWKPYNYKEKQMLGIA